MDYSKAGSKEPDALGVHCYSTHNSSQSFTADRIGKAIELNQALGARYVVLAHPGDVKDVDGWKRVADLLNKANDAMATHGLRAGYPIHALEWNPVGVQMPTKFLASTTTKNTV